MKVTDLAGKNFHTQLLSVNKITKLITFLSFINIYSNNLFALDKRHKPLNVLEKKIFILDVEY